MAAKNTIVHNGRRYRWGFSNKAVAFSSAKNSLIARIVREIDNPELENESSGFLNVIFVACAAVPLLLLAGMFVNFDFFVSLAKILMMGIGLLLIPTVFIGAVLYLIFGKTIVKNDNYKEHSYEELFLSRNYSSRHELVDQYLSLLDKDEAINFFENSIELIALNEQISEGKTLQHSMYTVDALYKDTKAKVAKLEKQRDELLKKQTPFNEKFKVMMLTDKTSRDYTIKKQNEKNIVKFLAS